MELIPVHPTILTSLIGFAFLLLIACGYMAYVYYMKEKKDAILMIDKSNRWSMARTQLKGLTTFKSNDSTYVLKEKCGLLNNRGKALYVFSENNPAPMEVRHNHATWLDGRSLMASINNELIKLMVKPKESFKDTLLLFGAIGGVLAGFSATLILLKDFGVI